MNNCINNMQNYNKIYSSTIITNNCFNHGNKIEYDLHFSKINNT